MADSQSRLQVRKIPFNFDEIPFQWNPANPGFGVLANFFSFVAVGFERYLIAAVREAIPRITDPAVRDEADLLVRQEAQHAGAHLRHLNALIAQYPGLRKTLDRTYAHFDELTESESLGFRLAHVADVEGVFAPALKLLIDYRGPLMGEGDARVSSLLTWHFIEEIEHRSSANLVYGAIVHDPRYRSKVAPRAALHMLRFYRLILDEFVLHIPPEVRMVSTRRLIHPLHTVALRLPGGTGRADLPAPFERLSTRDIFWTAFRVARSQTPHHDPGREPVPEWADEWFAAYEEGADMSTFVGVRGPVPR